MSDSKSPSPTNIDELKAHAGKIVRLMADPEPGLMTWNLMVADAVRGIISLTGAPPEPRSQRMEMALKAVLLYGEAYQKAWTPKMNREWKEISEALTSLDGMPFRTMSTLCDMVRAALKEDV